MYEQNTENLVTSDEDVESSETVDELINSAINNITDRKRKAFKTLSEIFDEESSNDEIPVTPTKDISVKTINEKSSAIKKRKPSGGYLDVSIDHVLKDKAPTSPQAEPENNVSATETTQQLKGTSFDDAQEILEYPPESGNVIRIEDYKCLDEKEMLTGSLIDFYMQIIHRKLMPEKLRNRVHFCSTNCYNLYALSSNFSGWNDPENQGLSSSERRYLRVKSFNEEVNLFEKDFIVIPCLNNEHWFLAIVCYVHLTGPVTIDGNVAVEKSATKRRKLNPDEGEPIKQPNILLFNSSKNGGGQSTEAINNIRNFIASEYKAKHQGEFPFSKIRIVGYEVASPKQSNNVDCGLFVLEYIEHFFFKSPINDYRSPIDLSNWFDETLVKFKRGEIATIIKELIFQTCGKLPELPHINCTYPLEETVMCKTVRSSESLKSQESSSHDKSKNADPLKSDSQDTVENLDVIVELSDDSGTESKNTKDESPNKTQPKSALVEHNGSAPGINKTLMDSFSKLMKQSPKPKRRNQRLISSSSSENSSSCGSYNDALEDQDEEADEVSNVRILRKRENVIITVDLDSE